MLQNQFFLAFQRIPVVISRKRQKPLLHVSAIWARQHFCVSFSLLAQSPFTLFDYLRADLECFFDCDWSSTHLLTLLPPRALINPHQDASACPAPDRERER